MIRARRVTEMTRMTRGWLEISPWLAGLPPLLRAEAENGVFGGLYQTP